jgi:hypothetical protein
MTKLNKASHKAIKKKCSGSQTMAVAELCKSIFTDIKEVGENNPFVNFDLKY